MRLFDSHNHLQDLALEPALDQTVAEALSAGLAGAAVNATSEGDWGRVATLASRFSWVRPQLGIHPWWVGNRQDGWQGRLRQALAGGSGVGEIGLDRWMLERARPDEPRLAGLRRAPMEEQVDVFREQLQLAVELDRPASIHCLEAWPDLVPILEQAILPARGFLLHAYGGPADRIAALARRGAYFSFSASFVAAVPPARALAFRQMPRERLLLETDAPAMAVSEPFRRYALLPGSDGRPLNHPANLTVAYDGLASILELPVAQLAGIAAENFRRLFGPA